MNDKVLFPVKKGTVTQGYYSTGSLDGQTYLQRFGTKTHAGTDIQSFHGDGLLAGRDMKCYKVFDLSTENLATGLSHGFGANFIEDLGGDNYREWIYWHTMSNISVRPEQLVKKGDIIAYEGDSGQVYENGVSVPDSAKGLPPYPGTHVHWARRDLVRTKESDNKYLLQTGIGIPYIDSEGYYYEVLNFDNGNKGCLDCEALPMETYDEFLVSQAAEVVSTVSVIVPQVDEKTQQSLLQSVVDVLYAILNFFIKGRL